MKQVRFLRDFYRNGVKYSKGDIVEFTIIQAGELLKRGAVSFDLKISRGKKEK